MPNIRILNWNIEKLSGKKVGIAGMAASIGQVIADSQADIVILLEVTSGTSLVSMAAVSAAANAAAGVANDYTGWLLSYDTGFECYGIIVRDLNVVRPVLAPGLAGAGTYANPALDNFDKIQFTTWPNTFAAMANAYAAPLPAAGARPRLPLINVFASEPPRGRKRSQFAGRVIGGGGYALGNGFRMPCLAMFQIQNNAGNATYLVPVMICHLGAVRSGTNHLARGQIQQYKDTHISQKFQNPAPLALPYNSYIMLDGPAKRIEEIVITGDFNVDFLDQAPPGVANALSTGNRAALNFLTPTTTGGGSALPAAAPGPAGPPPVALPFVAPGGAWPDPPVHTAIPNLALKTAVTAAATHLVHYHAGVVPANNGAALRNANFDNFFFGGTQLSANYQALTGNDACQIINLPALIVQAGNGGANAYDVSGAQAFYALKGKKDAAAAPALAPGAPVAALSTNDQLIGARLISDHLPVVMQVNFP